MSIERVESRSRALIVTLQDQENEKYLYICSVHLNADTDSDPKQTAHLNMIRQKQLKSILKRINLACKLTEQIIKESPIVIAGDFNMLRENPLLETLVDGSLTGSPSAYVSLTDAYLEAERHKQYSIPVYLDESPVECENERNSTKRDQHLVKTYKGGSILDYIWTSENVKVVNTLLYHPKSTILGPEKWPCVDHPSDHLPIGIDLEWNLR